MPRLRNGELWSLPPITTGCHGLLLNQWSSIYSKAIHPSCVYFEAPVVTIHTASLTFNNSTFCPHSVFMCFVWIWEQTTIISLYSINWLVCITQMECVYCTVRTGCLYIIQVITWFLCASSPHSTVSRPWHGSGRPLTAEAMSRYQVNICETHSLLKIIPWFLGCPKNVK